MMKKVSVLLLLFVLGFLNFFSQDIYAQQIIIGKKTTFLTSSSILEFDDNDARGIVLPRVGVNDLEDGFVPGTLIMDPVDSKVKYFKGEDEWVDLSVSVGQVIVNEQSNLDELPGTRIVFGENEVSFPGALILESSSKAMILPRVESPHLNIKNPPAGTIVFDTKSKMFCAYNGVEWSFWEVE